MKGGLTQRGLGKGEGVLSADYADGEDWGGEGEGVLTANCAN